MSILGKFKADLLRHTIDNFISDFDANILQCAIQNEMEIGLPYLYDRGVAPERPERRLQSSYQLCHRVG